MAKKITGEELSARTKENGYQRARLLDHRIRRENHHKTQPPRGLTRHQKYGQVLELSDVTA